MTRDELLAPGAGLELLLAMEEQRREVRERLAGVDSGPRTVRTIDGGER